MNDSWILIPITFGGAAAIFLGMCLIVHCIFHSRAVAVRRVVPNPVMQLGQLNRDTLWTLRDVFSLRHPPRILTWTFDGESATLWGARPKAGPVLKLARTQTLGFIPVKVFAKDYYPGIAIKVLDPASGEERLIGWQVRDPDHPFFPKKQEGVSTDLEALRRLWCQEGTYVDWNSGDIPRM